MKRKKSRPWMLRKSRWVWTKAKERAPAAGLGPRWGELLHRSGILVAPVRHPCCTGQASLLHRSGILVAPVRRHYAPVRHPCCTGPASLLHRSGILVAPVRHPCCTGPASLLHWSGILVAPVRVDGGRRRGLKRQGRKSYGLLAKRYWVVEEVICYGLKVIGEEERIDEL